MAAPRVFFCESFSPVIFSLSSVVCPAALAHPPSPPTGQGASLAAHVPPSPILSLSPTFRPASHTHFPPPLGRVRALLFLYRPAAVILLVGANDVSLHASPLVGTGEAAYVDNMGENENGVTRDEGCWMARGRSWREGADRGAVSHLVSACQEWGALSAV